MEYYIKSNNDTEKKSEGWVGGGGGGRGVGWKVSCNYPLLLSKSVKKKYTIFTVVAAVAATTATIT